MKKFLMAAALATTSFAAQAATFSFTGAEQGGAAVSGTLTIDTAAIQAANAASAPAVDYSFNTDDPNSSSALPFLSVVFNSNGAQPTLLSSGVTGQAIIGHSDAGFLSLSLSYSIDNGDGTFTSSLFTLDSNGPFATDSSSGALLPVFASAGNFFFTAQSGTGPNETYTTQSSGTVSFAPVAGVPESSTWATMVIGFGVAGASLRRARRRSALAA